MTANKMIKAVNEGLFILCSPLFVYVYVTQERKIALINQKNAIVKYNVSIKYLYLHRILKQYSYD